MTAYIAITDPETDPEAPLTSELAKKWRDNPIAIAECDASVPSTLRPTVLLGTLATTSGTTQTLSGLTLTPYKFLVVSFDLTYSTGSSGSVLLQGRTLHSGGSTFTNVSVKGIFNIDLFRGFGQSQFLANPATGTALSGITTSFSPVINNSTTSISVTTAGSGATLFGGDVMFYGVK